MDTIELFCGTRSFSKVMAEHGHSTFTIDNDSQHEPDVCIDILKFSTDKHYNILWASPPCTCFSVASLSHHWGGGICAYIPKSDGAKLGLQLLDYTIEIIAHTKPEYWFIENPRGMMRKMINPIFHKHNITDYHRTTITYCQYGDTRMKPTDIWTNLSGWFGKRCHNGDSCHPYSPRGSHENGTQGIKNAKDRGTIPPAIFDEILSHIAYIESHGK